jgi:hypothetical protein
MITRPTQASATGSVRHAPADAVRPPAASGVVNALGIVTAVLPGGIHSVESEGRTLRCMRAASCLLRPEIGDTVLVTGPDERRLYLTAVAEQADAGTARIDVQGDLTLASERGAVSVQSPTQLNLRGQGELNLGTSQLRIDAQAADCQVGHTTYQGEEVRATVLNIRVGSPEQDGVSHDRGRRTAARGPDRLPGERNGARAWQEHRGHGQGPDQGGRQANPHGMSFSFF